MKKLISLLALVVLMGCPVVAPLVDTPPIDVPPVDVPPAIIAVTGIELSASNLTLVAGNTHALSATVTPVDATNQGVTWVSSAPGVASVAGGVVTGEATGSAAIVVTSRDGGYTATCQVTVVPLIAPPPGFGTLMAALYDGATVRLFDGTQTQDWRTGVAVGANGRKVAVDGVLYFFAVDGSVESAITLPANPAGVIVWGDPVVYTFECITAEQAMAIDWTPHAATRIWQDGVELGDWHARSWTYASSFEAGNADVIAVDTIGRFHDVSRPALDDAMAYTKVIWAVPGGPIFTMPDSGQQFVLVVYDAAHPAGYMPVYHGQGIFRWAGQPWIIAGGRWYNGYGDVYDPASGDFYSHWTELKVFQTNLGNVSLGQGNHTFQFDAGTETASMIGAYADADNVYFVECNTGTLWCYTPQTDSISYVDRLYMGDGHDEMGLAKAKTLLPETLDGYLYFHDSGTLWRMDTGSTQIAAFSADQELWVMDK